MTAPGNGEKAGPKARRLRRPRRRAVALRTRHFQHAAPLAAASNRSPLAAGSLALNEGVLRGGSEAAAWHSAQELPHLGAREGEGRIRAAHACGRKSVSKAWATKVLRACGRGGAGTCRLVAGWPPPERGGGRSSLHSGQLVGQLLRERCHLAVQTGREHITLTTQWQGDG